MIFISLGTQKFQFNRLLQLMDDLKLNGLIKEEIFAQIGNSDYIPKSFEYATFLSAKEFDEKLTSCSCLVTHSGVGTILKAINNNKPIIVMPRLSKYKEHVDDHQVEIAKAFAKKNFVLMYTPETDMVNLISEAKTHTFDKYISSKKQVIERIENYLESLENNL
jgi:UDP-N-acetylglucosamine transferase subunit ALG13